MTFLFLGTGASTGIPMVGCHCSVCTSSDSHNKRLRPSGVVTIGDKKLLIDTGPDFRYQFLHSGIDHLDGVLLTHTHFDHIAGLDELRTFYLLHRQVLPILASMETLENLKKRYDYLFKEKSLGVSLAAQLHFQVLENKRGETQFLDLPLSYMTYEQGGMQVNGYRFGDFAYVSDIYHYPETIFEDLKGVRFLVLSALRTTPSPVHFTIEEAIAFAKKVGVEKVWFTHIAHEVDHQKTQATLPEGFALAYDGLSIEFNP
ncbi:MAG: Phosphoribosyl 1,2-cyclic phosphodiesterase [Chlamydiae bacterium]|nr:Phosphoribosyl 1,2-cyclic phosphodiesterase [Chlamydiota bacterium]